MKFSLYIAGLAYNSILFHYPEFQLYHGGRYLLRPREKSAGYPGSRKSYRT